MSPFGENRAVGTISKAHFLDLDEFEEEMFRGNLIATKDYVGKVTDFMGNSWKPDKGDLVFSNRKVHSAMLHLLERLA